MPRYLAIYIAGLSRDEKEDTPVDQRTQAAGMEAWGKWAQANEASIVDHGAPLGRTMAVDTHGVSPAQNDLTGYVLVEAPSLEDAAAIFRGHPHFSIFSGSRVEVMECLEMPS